MCIQFIYTWNRSEISVWHIKEMRTESRHWHCPSPKQAAHCWEAIPTTFSLSLSLYINECHYCQHLLSRWTACHSSYILFNISLLLILRYICLQWLIRCFDSQLRKHTQIYTLWLTFIYGTWAVCVMCLRARESSHIIIIFTGTSFM